MASKLELSLEEANGELVSLKNLSGEALSSFLAVVGSLKAMIEEQSDESQFIYRIVEGSASFIAESKNEVLNSFYGEFNSTVKEGSYDKSFVGNLKRIQSYLKSENLGFKFYYYPNGSPKIDLKEKVVTSRIRSKRTKNKFSFKLEIVSGLLNQIGGNNPNYHLDHGNNKKLTIFCEKEEAISIREFLYKNIKCLVETKAYSSLDKEDVYNHKIVLDDKTLTIIRPFINEYNKIVDIIKKLEFIHEYTLKVSQDKDSLLKFLKTLTIGFSSQNFHQSEIKTVLILTKPFKEYQIISKERNKLLEVYNIKSSQK